ncbi:putative methyltransferase (TIGR04325 family) [Aquabacterium commune]|uniref:Putative methyltransferase (TIGR04325 family) n=1 Tax=Aquabacterium commune TaxID=70586 RepID=A0A4R6REM6_9BURK|nr:methyltransferase, TIGR04325 family [Aquabacterium commune]TDP84709.1 putative methyltransferase (TIGR04325 family) [Aquabacterium commune]
MPLALIKRLPLIRSWLHRRAIRKYFSPRGSGCHSGHFSSFAQARAWLPPSPEFSHDKFTDEYVHERSRRIWAFDYPVLFWLREAFAGGSSTVLDIGGSIGNQYYAYQRYLRYPEALQWRVQELSAFIGQGRELAQQRGAAALSFSDAWPAEWLDSEVWLAAGVLEFMESQDLPSLLARCARKPRHILLNKLPLSESPAFVSSQNIGFGSYVPHHVFNRRDFIGAIESLGYELVDTWDVPERSFQSLGFDEDAFDVYSGLYFRATH